jgi:hypothetical protein
MSGYLALAKKASERAKADVSPDELAARKERKLEEAGGLGLIIRWCEYPSWIRMHDPTTGEWHEVRASECLPGVVKTADAHRRKTKKAEEEEVL